MSVWAVLEKQDVFDSRMELCGKLIPITLEVDQVQTFDFKPTFSILRQTELDTNRTQSDFEPNSSVRFRTETEPNFPFKIERNRNTYPTLWVKCRIIEGVDWWFVGFVLAVKFVDGTTGKT